MDVCTMKKILLSGLFLILIAGCDREIPAWYAYIPHESSPIVSVSLRFDTGSAIEPEDKKGISRLTMMSVLEHSTKQSSRSEILKELNDRAISERIIVDTDVSTFLFRLHKDHMDTWLSLFKQRFYNPAFAEHEVQLLIRQEKERLEHKILYRSEDLSRDVLVDKLFSGHPYAGLSVGYPYTLMKLSGEDLKVWWEQSFSVHNMHVAVSGPVSPDQQDKLIEILSDFHPRVHPPVPELPPPVFPDTIHYVLIDNGSDVSAVSLGWHLPFNRSDKKFYPSWIFSSYLGEHRTFYGHLMKELRVKRGFNYGDYAYSEHFVQNHHSVFPQPGHPRLYQYFSIWIRPLKNQNVPFALRLVFHDLENFQKYGLDSLDYVHTKDFLTSYINLYAQNQADYLGFSQDYAYYGLENFPASAQQWLDSTDYQTGQDIIKDAIDLYRMVVVVVGGDTDSLETILTENLPVSPLYTTQPGADVLKRDQGIEAFPLPPGIIERYGTLDFLQKR
jgi:zinc protease